MATFVAWVELVGRLIESAGVAVIVLGLVVVTYRYVGSSGARDSVDGYNTYRRNLGRAILLGLEVLVAGDIVRTVAAEPTIRSVLVLGLIVLIRTFLSVSLELEIEGRWPWRKADAREAQTGRGLPTLEK